MGKKTDKAVKDAGRLDADMIEWAAKAKRGADTINNLIQFIEDGLDMLWHQASAASKKYKVEGQGKTLAQVYPPFARKELTEGLQAVKDALNKVKPEIGKFWKEIPPQGLAIIAECKELVTTIEDITKAKFDKSRSPNPQTLKALGQACEQVHKARAAVLRVLDETSDVPSVTNKAFLDAGKLSDATTMGQLEQTTGAAFNEVHKGQAAFNAMNTRLAQVRAAKLSLTKKLLQTSVKSLEQECGLSQLP